MKSAYVVDVMAGGVIKEPKTQADYFFYVMPKYQYSLDEYLDSFTGDPLQKIKHVVDIISQLVFSLKMVHISGYVYNDLKPENVVIDV